MKAVLIIVAITLTVVGSHFAYNAGYDLAKSIETNSKPPVVIIKEKVQPIIVENNNGTLAFKNKNPLNVKCFNITWKGQTGTDKFGHAVFSTWEYGVRAASYVLKNYYKHHKIDTLNGIVNRFARGNTKEYIEFLCKHMNLKKDEKFNVINRMSELLKYMARWESGQELPDELFIPYDVLTHI